MAQREIDDRFQIAQFGPAIIPLPCQRHGVDAAFGGAFVDGVGQLDLSAKTRWLGAQDVEDLGFQNVSADRRQRREFSVRCP